MGAANASIRVNAHKNHIDRMATHVVEPGESDANIEDAASSVNIEMTDCDKMAAKSVKSAAGGDCPCCDTKSACPPDFCPLKIYKVAAMVSPPGANAPRSGEVVLPEGTWYHPDWISKPQPPPPRT